MLDLTEAMKTLEGALPRLAPSERAALALVLDALRGPGHAVGDARARVCRVNRIVHELNARCEAPTVALVGLVAIASICSDGLPHRLTDMVTAKVGELEDQARRCPNGPGCLCRSAVKHAQELTSLIAPPEQRQAWS